MGQARRLLARAAAFSLGPSSTLLPMSSLVSAVLAGLFDVWLLSDNELSEGDSRLALRTWLCGAWSVCVDACAGDCACEGAGDTAGDRFLPLLARDRRPGTCERPWWEKRSCWVGEPVRRGSRRYAS